MKVGPSSADAVHYTSISGIVHPPHFWTTPRMDYDFEVPGDGNYYVWMRAQGGPTGITSSGLARATRSKWPPGATNPAMRSKASARNDGGSDWTVRTSTTRSNASVQELGGSNRSATR